MAPDEDGNKRPCDVDDIICQMQVISHLRGLQSALGNESFTAQFPELDGLNEKLTEKIQEREWKVEQSMEECADSEDIVVQPQHVISEDHFEEE